LFFIHANRFQTDTGRHKLDGWALQEIVWFNGYDHCAVAEGYMEFWYTNLETGEDLYHYSDYTLTSTWGGFALLVIGLKVTISFPDHDKYDVEKIHVYTERVVDDFETEYYNKVFYEYIINPHVIKVPALGMVQNIMIKESSSEVVLQAI